MTKIFADKGWEYKFVSEPSITFQKLLNQWKHQYELCIIHIEFTKAIESCELFTNSLIARRPNS
jgi:hypothetical protein